MRGYFVRISGWLFVHMGQQLCVRILSCNKCLHLLEDKLESSIHLITNKNDSAVVMTLAALLVVSDNGLQ